jgi:hypothetical protein
MTISVRDRARLSVRPSGCLWAVPFLLAAVGTAGAQTVIIDQRNRADDRANLVQVQVAVGLTIPNPGGNGELSLQAQERARRAIYQVAAHECELLRSVIANDCRLQSLNVAVNPQYGAQAGEMPATGNFSLSISLK